MYWMQVDADVDVDEDVDVDVDVDVDLDVDVLDAEAAAADRARLDAEAAAPEALAVCNTMWQYAQINVSAPNMLVTDAKPLTKSGDAHSHRHSRKGKGKRQRVKGRPVLGLYQDTDFHGSDTRMHARALACRPTRL